MAIRAAAKNGKAPARKSTLRVSVIRLGHATGLDLPSYQSNHAAGLDLLAALPDDKPMRLKPRERALVPTGLIIELPAGFEGQVRPRSGLALREGLTVLNAPGTIDADYRGEVHVLLVNFGGKPVTLRRGDRIAQLVVAPVTRVELVPTIALTTTKRGAGGFGSTGVTRKPGAARKATR